MSSDSYMNTTLKIRWKMDKLGLFIDAPNYESCIKRIKQESKLVTNKKKRVNPTS